MSHNNDKQAAAEESVDTVDPTPMEIELIVVNGTPTQSSPRSKLSSSSSSCGTAFLPPLLLFVVLSVTSFGLLFAFATFTSQLASADEGFAPFRVLRIQLIFYVGILLGCAEATMRTSANASGLLPTTRMSVLVLLFVCTVILVPTVPSISERPAQSSIVAPFRGGCSNDLPWANVKNVCPPLAQDQDGARFLRMASNGIEDIGIDGRVRDAYNSLERVVGAIPLVNEAESYYKKDNYSTLQPFISGHSAHKASIHFLEKDCLYHATDWFCARILTPCQYDDCAPLNATVCSVGEMQRWLQCAKDKCVILDDCDPNEITPDLLHGMVRALQHWLFVILPGEGYDFKDFMAVHEFTFFKGLLQLLLHDLAEYSLLMDAIGRTDCDPTSESNFDPSAPRRNATSCNSNVTSLSLSGGDVIPDGSYVLLVTFVTLTLVVSVSSCNGITVAKPHRVAIINGVLGSITATMIFVGALNIERFVSSFFLIHIIVQSIVLTVLFFFFFFFFKSKQVRSLRPTNRSTA